MLSKPATEITSERKDRGFIKLAEPTDLPQAVVVVPAPLWYPDHPAVLLVLPVGLSQVPGLVVQLSQVFATVDILEDSLAGLVPPPIPILLS